MSVNVTTETTTLMSETVATNLILTRTVAADASATYTATLQYATHSFVVGADGKPVSVVSLNQNPGSIGMGIEETGAVFMTPITYNGTETVLGEVLAEMMDAKILSFLTPPAPQP